MTEKAKYMAIGLVFEGKWDLLQLPVSCDLFYFILDSQRTTCKFASLLYIKRLNISEWMTVL